MNDNEMSRTFTQLAKSVVAVLSPQAATGSAASTQSAGSIPPNKSHRFAIKVHRTDEGAP